MLRAGVGQSSNPSTEKAVEEAAGQAMSRAGIAKADSALVFFTVHHLIHPDRLMAVLRATTGTEQISGCTGAGVLTGDGEIEGGPGIAVLVLSSEQVGAHPFLFHPLREREREVGLDIGQTVTPQARNNPLLVLFPDPYNGQSRLLLREIEEHLGPVPIVGAGCSESGNLGKTYQLFGEQLRTNAVSGLVLTGPFESSVGITQGCQPITEPMVITKADGNLIFEIGHRPAFEVFARVIKGPLLDDLRRALAFVFVGLPADLSRGGVGPGEYLVRNIVGLDPEKGVLAVGEEVREGEPMIFALRDGQRAREDLDQMLQRQLKSLGGKKPRFGLYFNCCARGASLYGIPGMDTAYIGKSLKDIPLIGFFGSFELGPLGGKNRLLAYTGVLVLITEKG